LSKAWATPIPKAIKFSFASVLGKTFVKIREIYVSSGSFATIGENILE
ncbi:4906_t:CDS:1, partial [Gigaspora rosea]